MPNRIRELRQAKGWTQMQLADKAHIWPARLSEYETGARIPDVAIAHDLADALGVTIEELGLPRRPIAAEATS